MGRGCIPLSLGGSWGAKRQLRLGRRPSLGAQPGPGGRGSWGGGTAQRRGELGASFRLRSGLSVRGVGEPAGRRRSRDYISQQAARCASPPAAPAARVWERASECLLPAAAAAG